MDVTALLLAAGELNPFAECTIAALAHVGPEQVREFDDHSFTNLQAVGKIGLFSLLFLTGLESELDELMAVGMEASTVAAGWSDLSREPTNRLAVGLGTMPRGEVGLIFLGLGTQTGVLGSSLEAAIRPMVIDTTFLAPVLLRLVLTDPGAAAEVATGTTAP